MKKFAFFSLRYRLLLLVLIAVLPSLWLILHTASEHRRSAALEVQKNALRVVRLASAGQERLIDGAHQLLVVMAQLNEVRGSNPKAAHLILLKLLKQYSAYTNFGVMELNGSLFASAQPVSPKLNLKDRSYFTRALETGDFAMGDYQIGRITNKPTVNFGYPVRDDSGKIVRVVFAALDLAWLSQLASQADLPPGATLSIVDAQGTVLAGWPDPGKWRGRSIKDHPILPIIQARHEGTAETTGPDGLPRLYAFMHLRGAEGTGFVSVSVGIPDQVAFSEPNRMLKQNLIGLGMVAALALASAWFGGNFFILQRLRVLVNATQQLESGDLRARTGLRYGKGEIGQLAHAFDKMAAALEQRSEEQEQAEGELKTLNEELEQRVAQRTQELMEKNQQFEADMELARELQVGLLPERQPLFRFHSPGGASTFAARFAHCYEPSGGVGGDYFCIFPVSPSETGLFVCDVMGHGVRAALVTAIIRGLVEEMKLAAPEPDVLMAEMNKGLIDVLQETRTTMFATAAYLVVDIEKGRLRYSNGGHPRPLHFHRKRGIVAPVPLPEHANGPAIGLFKEAVYSVIECKLEPGDAILSYTDGVFEASNQQGEQYGEDRLLAAAQKYANLPLGEIYPKLLGEIRAFAEGKEFDDDVCMVGFEWTGGIEGPREDLAWGDESPSSGSEMITQPKSPDPARG